MPRRAVAEIVASLALLAVTIGLSGGLALTYYGWLHGYSAQNSILEGQATQLTSYRVYVVAAAAGAPSRVWLLNAGEAPATVSQVYSDGSLLSPNQWGIVDSTTGANATSLLPGRLYKLTLAASSSVVIYFGDLYSLQAVLGA